jgi:hypothetical protein
VYLQRQVKLSGNRGSLAFPASGELGNHYVYLQWPGEKSYSRYINFHLEAETGISSGDRDFDVIYPHTHAAVRLGRRDYPTPAGRFVGYIAGDTLRFDGIWLRDFIYALPAYKYWELEMQCGLDRFFEQQRSNGQVPDGIMRNGQTWRVPLESDVEYIAVLGVWETWKATGDDAWLRRLLPKVAQALNYITNDPKHWDEKYQLVKRQHSCDTWDFDIDGAGSSGQSRHVIANCDQSGYALAFQRLGDMYRRLGDIANADRWQNAAQEYRERAVRLLWDGTKFLHHVHLDPIDHGDFDESQQLSMGNTWAATRGLARPDQATAIVDEYRRRHLATGDKYPWWSLQPGYPDHLNYWSQPSKKQGAYANGGLMPWVGGELSRAALQNRRERYGVELIRQYAAHLRETGGAMTWYWPDGTPGHRTTNEVDYSGWGMAEWVAALIEGLAGIRDLSGQFRDVEVAVRWAAAGVRQARTTAHYAASNTYFSYEWKAMPQSVSIAYSGSAQKVRFRLLLADGFIPHAVKHHGQDLNFTIEGSGESRYLEVAVPDAQRGEFVVEAKP